MARTQPLLTVAGRWLAYLWHEWTVETWAPIAPAPAKPRPNEWPNDRLTAAWLGHATVFLNFFGITILTDPVLLRRIGIPLPFTAIGPKRLTAPALAISELPPIDLILLSHAHFDHLDWRTLRRFQLPPAGRDRAADARFVALDQITADYRTPLGRGHPRSNRIMGPFW